MFCLITVLYCLENAFVSRRLCIYLAAPMPQTPQGLCSGPRWGFPSPTPSVHPTSKPWLRHCPAVWCALFCIVINNTAEYMTTKAPNEQCYVSYTESRSKIRKLIYLFYLFFIQLQNFNLFELTIHMYENTRHLLELLGIFTENYWSFQRSMYMQHWSERV